MTRRMTALEFSLKRTARPLAAVELPGADRRAHHRYPLDLEIRCRELRSTHAVFGRVRNMSSGGICFTSGEPLRPGTAVEVSIDWPCAANESCPLLLRGRGRVVRSNRWETAIVLLRHGFYTRKAQSA